MIVPLIKFFISGISDDNAEFIHFFIRKSGHITEYFILCGLIVRAYCKGYISITYKQILYSLFIVALYASCDEIHQSFVATRTASITDIGIDIIGGVIFAITIAIFRLAVLFRMKNITS